MLDPFISIDLSIYLSRIYPVPRVQSPSSSATVQSLAFTLWQMFLAWLKVFIHSQPSADSGPPQSSDSPQTEQSVFFTQPARAVSEQQRTCMAVGSGGHATVRVRARDI